MTSGHSNVSELDAAYRATAYVVEQGESRISIRIDQCSPEIDRLLLAGNCRDWAFISASNPGSLPLSLPENRKRHTELISAIEALGFGWCEGHGVPDRPGWPPEISLFIMGIQPEEAVKLAARFGQNAIVIGTLGKAAKLCYVHGN